MSRIAAKLRCALATLASVCLALAAVRAQEPQPAPIPYVASVKENTFGPGWSFTRRLPGGTFLASNMLLRDMIAFAYGLQPFQIEGAPDWIDRARFDATMKAEANVGPAAIGPAEIGLQLSRALLADRFAFRAHRETRERPVFALVRARQDGLLGPRLRRSATDCPALAKAAGESGAPWPPRAADGRILCGLQTQGNTLTAGGYPLAEFQRFLTAQTRRVVIDRTGSPGRVGFRSDVRAARRARRRPHRASEPGLTKAGAGTRVSGVGRVR